MNFFGFSTSTDSGFPIWSVSPLIAVIIFVSKEMLSWRNERRAACMVLAACAVQVAKEMAKEDPDCCDAYYGKMLDAACRAGMHRSTVELVLAINHAIAFIHAGDFSAVRRNQELESLRSPYLKLAARLKGPFIFLYPAMTLERAVGTEAGNGVIS